mmetsp:Transcript_57649/g.187300  ORF Transcript_57649/g.187300 Transcript_57649/m.187300 type:complete len:242 (+) Transcript_57649:174-899(+)
MGCGTSSQSAHAPVQVWVASQADSAVDKAVVEAQRAELGQPRGASDRNKGSRHREQEDCPTCSRTLRPRGAGGRRSLGLRGQGGQPRHRRDVRHQMHVVGICHRAPDAFGGRYLGHGGASEHRQAFGVPRGPYTDVLGDGVVRGRGAPRQGAVDRRPPGGRGRDPHEASLRCDAAHAQSLCVSQGHQGGELYVRVEGPDRSDTAESYRLWLGVHVSARRSHEKKSGLDLLHVARSLAGELS